MRVASILEIRRDGQIITEAMTPTDVEKFGWPPEKVVRVEWMCGTEQKAIENPCGLLARCLPDKSGIAVLQLNGESLGKQLDVWNADGSLRFSRDASVTTDDAVMYGDYVWFEPARSASPQEIGVTFSHAADRSMFQLDLDAHTGEVVAIFRLA